MTENVPVQPPRTSFLSLVGRVVFAALVAGLLVAYGTYFLGKRGPGAVVTCFGEPVREISEAGPVLEMALADRTSDIARRPQEVVNTSSTATFTRDKRGAILLTM